MTVETGSWMALLASLVPGHDLSPVSSKRVPYVISLGQVHALPHKLRPAGSPIPSTTPIGTFSDLVHDDRLIGHIFHSTAAPSAIIVSANLLDSSNISNIIDEQFHLIDELQAELPSHRIPVTLIACNANQFMDNVSEFMADVMAGALRRKCHKLNASLFYSQHPDDVDSILHYIYHDICPGLVDSQVLCKPTLSHAYLMIPAGFDTSELIDKLTAPEENFLKVFPAKCPEVYSEPARFVARADDEFMELLRSDMDKQSQFDVPRTPSKRSESRNMSIYQTPATPSPSTSATPSVKSQIAVKSFFESLLSPRSKEDLSDHRQRQRHAEDALCDINNSNL